MLAVDGAGVFLPFAFSLNAKSLIMLSLKCGCVNSIVPPSVQVTLTPRYSSRLPLSVISKRCRRSVIRHTLINLVFARSAEDPVISLDHEYRTPPVEDTLVRIALGKSQFRKPLEEEVFLPYCSCGFAAVEILNQF